MDAPAGLEGGSGGTGATEMTRLRSRTNVPCTSKLTWKREETNVVVSTASARAPRRARR